jgi:hypothetical protein
MRRRIAIIGGVYSLLYLVLFWTLLLTPLGEHVVFNGSGTMLFGGLFLAIASSIAAALLENRKWLFSTAGHVGTYIFIAMRIH